MQSLTSWTGRGFGIERGTGRGFRPDEAVFYELPDVPGDLQSDTLFGVAVPTAGHPQGVPLDAAAETWSSSNSNRVRVVTFQGYDEPAALGGMRWALEFARLDRHFHGAMALIGVTHVASQDRIRALGAGGAAYHHAAPEQRQANAAASVAVTDVLGPQHGQYRGTFGPLFRNADDSMPDDVFARRAVAFAAFHREDIETWEASSGQTIAQYVAAADPSGAQWWAALRQDDAFQRLAAAGRVVMPLREETDAAKRAAALLWETAVDLYKRGEQRALEIL